LQGQAEKTHYRVPQIRLNMKRKVLNKDVRRKILRKYKSHCAYCGCILELKDMQIDHIIPYSRKSDIEIGRCYDNNWVKIDYKVDDYENLNPSCRSCNKWKGVWSVEEFRGEIQSQISRLTQKSAGFRIAIRYELIEPTHKKVEFYFETLIRSGITNRKDKI